MPGGWSTAFARFRDRDGRHLLQSVAMMAEKWDEKDG